MTVKEIRENVARMMDTEDFCCDLCPYWVECEEEGLCFGCPQWEDEMGEDL